MCACVCVCGAETEREPLTPKHVGSGVRFRGGTASNATCRTLGDRLVLGSQVEEGGLRLLWRFDSRRDTEEGVMRRFYDKSSPVN